MKRNLLTVLVALLITSVIVFFPKFLAFIALFLVTLLLVFCFVEDSK